MESASISATAVSESDVRQVVHLDQDPPMIVMAENAEGMQVEVEDDGYDPRKPEFMAPATESEMAAKNTKLRQEQIQKLEAAISKRWSRTGSEVVQHYKSVVDGMSTVATVASAAASTSSTSSGLPSGAHLDGLQLHSMEEDHSGLSMFSAYTWSPASMRGDLGRHFLDSLGDLRDDVVGPTRTRSRSPALPRPSRSSGSRPSLRELFD